MSIRINTLIFILLALATTTQCQDYFQLTVRDGLPSNTVYGAIKDSEGFIWFFTDNGVAKYDGYDLKTFKREDGLEDSDIWHIHEDKHQRKWLISSTVLGYYIENDSVKHIDQPVVRQVFPQDISFIDEGWVFKYQGLMYVLLNEKLHHIPADSVQNDQMIAHFLNELEISGESKNAIAHYLDHNQEDIENNQFLSAYSRGVANGQFVYESHKYEFQITESDIRLVVYKENQNTIVNLQDVGVEKITAVNKKDELLYIHHTKGRLVYDLKTEKIIENYFIPFLKHKLTRTLVDPKFLIGGSFYDGAIICSPALNDSQRLEGETIISISVTRDNNIQLLTEENEVFIYNTLNGICKQTLEADERFLKEYIIKYNKKSYLFHDQTIMNFSDNEVLFQGSNDTIFREGTSSIHMHLSNSKDMIHFDSTILVQWYNVLYSINLKNDNHIYIGKHGADISCVERFQDDILIGTSTGIRKIIDRKSKRFLKLDPLPQNNITDLRSIEDHHLIAITDYTNLHIWNNEKWILNMNFNSPITDICLSDTYIYGLTADHLFRINMLTDYTLEKFYFHSISNIGRVISLESTEEAIFMGTENGFYQMNHQDLKTIEDTPIFIDLNVLNNQGVVEDEKLKNIRSTDNDLKFTFKALSIVSLGNIEYNYRLLPSELKWNATKDIEAVYTSLSAQDYTFEVFAVDAFGNKGELQQLNIRIQPAWYESLSFYIIASLFLVFAVSILYFFRLKNIRESEAKKTLMNKKIAQYELQALRAQMNPHFIFNVLSSIQNAIRNQDVETADNHLYNFASLIRKFLEFSEKRVLVLKEEIELIKLYSKIENLRFDPKVDIQFIIDAELDLENTFIPSMLLQPLVENAINHGLFYKKGDRELMLSFKSINDNLVIKIEDNGVGRDESYKKKRKRATNHTSKAFLNIQNRIDILNQSEDVKIEYSIDDLKDVNGKAIGTRVNLLILNHDTNSYNNRR